jgi:ketosteroid isomerase-like protein
MAKPDEILSETSLCEARLRAAVLSGDADALDELLADDLVLTDQGGRILTKAMDLDAHRSGRLRVSKLVFSEALSRRAEGAVVVVVRAAIAGTFDNADFSGDYRYTRVWSKRAGKWQIVAAHCSAIA